MRWVKFIKHVYEILFKCVRKIHGDVHTAHNHASRLHSLQWHKTFNLG